MLPVWLGCWLILPLAGPGPHDHVHISGNRLLNLVFQTGSLWKHPQFCHYTFLQVCNDLWLCLGLILQPGSHKPGTNLIE